MRGRPSSCASTCTTTTGRRTRRTCWSTTSRSSSGGKGRPPGGPFSPKWGTLLSSATGFEPKTLLQGKVQRWAAERKDAVMGSNKLAMLATILCFAGGIGAATAFADGGGSPSQTTTTCQNNQQGND